MVEGLRKLTLDELDRATLEQYATQPKQPVVAVLDNIRSLANVGSIFRSADAFALRHLYLCGFTGQPPHPEIHKAALGSTESVAWSQHASITDCLTMLRTEGYLVLALEQTDTGALLPDVGNIRQAGQPVALVLGNEVKGVSDEALALCHSALEIPQYGTKHSLNVAVAAGIAFYQLTLPV